MTLEKDFNQNSMTRQELLLAWMRRNGLSASEMGRRMGVSAVYCWKLVKCERAPVMRVEQLKSMGIPDHLLPVAEDRKRGNKKGWRQRPESQDLQV